MSLGFYTLCWLYLILTTQNSSHVFPDCLAASKKKIWWTPWPHVIEQVEEWQKQGHGFWGDASCHRSAWCSATCGKYRKSNSNDYQLQLFLVSAVLIASFWPFVTLSNLDCDYRVTSTAYDCSDSTKQPTEHQIIPLKFIYYRIYIFQKLFTCKSTLLQYSNTPFVSLLSEK